MASIFGELPSSKLTIPMGGLIAVSGANGCMGSHISDQLLFLGYQVRGIVRNVERCRWLDDYFDKKYGSGLFKLFEVPIMDVDGACDDAVAGAAGVIHVAADTSLELNPYTVIPRIVAMTLGVAKSAAKSPSCRRFVCTSSSSAVSEPNPGVGRTLTRDTFNEEAIIAAYSKNLAGGVVGGHMIYAAGKTRAEQELWKWYNETDREFELNVVIPSPCFGPALQPEKQGFAAANRVLKMLWDGDRSDDIVGAFQAQWYCDVRDVSRLHLGALLLPDVRSERLFACAARFTINEIMSVFREVCPRKSFPDDVPGVKMDMTEVPNQLPTEILRLLGLPGWTPLKQSLESLAKQFGDETEKM